MSEKLPGGETRETPATGSRTAEPPLFRVLMHNDDYTSMEFVVEVLEEVFHKSPTEANRIMLNIHVQGNGVCGTYPHEIAETKQARVHTQARAEGFPLQCSLEEV